MHPESIALVQSSQPLNGLEIDIRLVERASRQVWNGVLGNQLLLCTNTSVAWKSHLSRNHAPLLGINRGISTKNTRSCCMRAHEIYRVQNLYTLLVKEKKSNWFQCLKIDDEMTTVLVFYRFITVTFYYDQNLFHLTALVLYIYQDIITKSAHLFFFVHTPRSINQEGRNWWEGGPLWCSFIDFRVCLDSMRVKKCRLQ